MPQCWRAQWEQGERGIWWGGKGFWNNRSYCGSKSCESGASYSLANASPPLLLGLVVLASAFTLAMGGINAARTLHAALLENKFHTPQSFYDTTPTGRIINRFSKDIYVIDEVIPSTILMFLGTFFTSLATLIVIIASTPLFTVVIIPLAILYFFVQVTGKIPDSIAMTCILLFMFLFRKNNMSLAENWNIWSNYVFM